MRALKAVLVAMGVWCLLSAGPGTVLPWSSIVRYVELLGYQALPDHPLVVYCVRLASLAFSLIGVFLLLLAINPVRYRAMLVVALCGLFVTAAAALATGWLTQMRPPWYLVDVAVCSIAGVLILALWPRGVERVASG